MGNTFQWETRRPLVMGILNVTPDSFSDGGRFAAMEHAVAQGEALVAAGADILDIGGESSRPGSAPVSVEEELHRVIPVIERLRTKAAELAVPISVDTTKAVVARAALAAGARIVNDISALRFDSDLAAVVREAGAGLVLMHMAGTPATMQQSPVYDDVVREVGAFLAERVQSAEHQGLTRGQLAVDPGLGFGKTVEHNVALLANLAALRSLGCAVVVGASRKSFIGKLLGRDLGERLAGSLATAAWAVLQGAAVVRVHDVAETVDVVRMLQALGQQKRQS